MNSGVETDFAVSWEGYYVNNKHTLILFHFFINYQLANHCMIHHSATWSISCVSQSPSVTIFELFNGTHLLFQVSFSYVCLSFSFRINVYVFVRIWGENVCENTNKIKRQTDRQIWSWPGVERLCHWRSCGWWGKDFNKHNWLVGWTITWTLDWLIGQIAN